MKFCLASTFLVFQSSYATIQIPELLVCGKDTFVLLEKPLAQNFARDTNFLKDYFTFTYESIGKNRMTVQTPAISSNCWRGYRGTWAIINDSLFLVDLRPCFERKAEENPLDIAKIFDTHVPKKGVYANWVFLILRSEYHASESYKFRQAYVVVFGKVVKQFKLRRKCEIFSVYDILRCHTPWKFSTT